MYILLALIVLLWALAGVLWIADATSSRHHVDAILADPESTRRVTLLEEQDLLAA